jgi:hypothetical protein
MVPVDGKRRPELLQLDERLVANSSDSIIYSCVRWLRWRYGWKPRTGRCHSYSDADSYSVSIGDTDRSADCDSDGISVCECFIDGEGSGGLCASVSIGKGERTNSGG